MKLFILLAVCGYWALTLCAPVPVMVDVPEMVMDGNNSGDGGHGGGHMMPMWFHVSEHCTILFEEWHTMTYGELVGSAIALAVLAALYEGYKVAREELLARMTSNSSSQITISGAGKVGSQEMMVTETVGRPPQLTLLSGPHLLQALLHFIQVWISYLLMLAFMTYNVVVCVFICFGAGVGYWLFAWRRSRIQDNNEHCH